MAKLNPSYCTHNPSGIDCTLVSSSKTKRSILADGEIVALPIVIGSAPVGSVQKRQISASTVPIPKDLKKISDKGANNVTCCGGIKNNEN